MDMMLVVSVSCGALLGLGLESFTYGMAYDTADAAPFWASLLAVSGYVCCLLALLLFFSCYVTVNARGKR